MTVAGVIRTPVVLDRLVERTDYAVIGPTDGRIRVIRPTPPYSSVCHVERDFGDGRLSGCTGFLVGPRLVVTAGHCTYSLLRRRTPRRILVTPGRDGARRPFGTVRALRWYGHPLFLSGADPRYDFGVLVLARPFAGLAPALRLRAPGAAELAGIRDRRLIRITGYPSDKPKGQLWTHAERLDRFGARLLNYSVDTCPGHSGAPVWLVTPRGRRDVIGVHTRGPKPSARGPWGCRPGAPLAPPAHFNAGVRVTADLIAAIRGAFGGGGSMRLLGVDSAT